MNPDLVARRRSTVFQRIQLELTQSSVIRERIQPGKFPASSVGIIQIISVILLLCAAISHISISKCPKTEDWYTWLLPLSTCSGTVVVILFYGIFTLGLARRYPNFWFITDILFCIILAVFIISTSVITMIECTSTETVHTISGPFGITGAIFLIFSGAGLYIMYRNKETIVEEVEAKPIPKIIRTISTDVDV